MPPAVPLPAQTSREITAAHHDHAESATWSDLVERARELLRVAEFGAAERLLLRALELLPGGRVPQHNLQVLARRRDVSVIADRLITSH